MCSLGFYSSCRVGHLQREPTALTSLPSGLGPQFQSLLLRPPSLFPSWGLVGWRMHNYGPRHPNYSGLNSRKPVSESLTTNSASRPAYACPTLQQASDEARCVQGETMKCVPDVFCLPDIYTRTALGGEKLQTNTECEKLSGYRKESFQTIER